MADAHRASARNLLHYLELRKADLRPIQEQLASLGISSLGHAESNVLANLDKVLGILHRLLRESWADQSCDEPAGLHMASKLLQDHTRDLLGDPPNEREVRIMVTLPSEAAREPELVDQLVSADMDVARINCAHDDAEAWTAMAVNVRRAARKLGRSVRILMDLGGPKLRTDQMPAGQAVVKLRPARDELGRVTAPGLLGLRPDGSLSVVPGASVHVSVKAKWLASLRIGDWIDLVDARKAHRKLRVVAVDDAGALVRSDKTVYLLPQTSLECSDGRLCGGPAPAASGAGRYAPESGAEDRDSPRIREPA